MWLSESATLLDSHRKQRQPQPFAPSGWSSWVGMAEAGGVLDAKCFGTRLWQEGHIWGVFCSDSGSLARGTPQFLCDLELLRCSDFYT